MNKIEHISVMQKEILNNFIDTKDHSCIIDCTFGFGGHSQILLENLKQKKIKIFGFDRDITVKKHADKIAEKYSPSFTFHCTKFTQIPHFLKRMHGIEKISGGFIMDLGVSSMQIDNPERGFSFLKSGPLSMQMGCNDTINAQKIVNSFTEKEIEQIILQYGEDKNAKKIAKAISIQRKQSKIKTTTELANIITQCLAKQKRGKIHPATKTFQAIRIYINDEINEIKNSLPAFIDMLEPKAQISIITFHYMEDKIVKEIFAQYSKKEKSNKFLNNKKNNTTHAKTEIKTFLCKKQKVSRTEALSNPRSRSANLRSLRRIS